MNVIEKINESIARGVHIREHLEAQSDGPDNRLFDFWEEALLEEAGELVRIHQAHGLITEELEEEILLDVVMCGLTYPEAIVRLRKLWKHWSQE